MPRQIELVNTLLKYALTHLYRVDPAWKIYEREQHEASKIALQLRKQREHMEEVRRGWNFSFHCCLLRQAWFARVHVCACSVPMLAIDCQCRMRMRMRIRMRLRLRMRLRMRMRMLMRMLLRTLASFFFSSKT